jgi:hypothetical protein
MHNQNERRWGNFRDERGQEEPRRRQTRTPYGREPEGFNWAGRDHDFDDDFSSENSYRPTFPHYGGSMRNFYGDESGRGGYRSSERGMHYGGEMGRNQYFGNPPAQNSDYPLYESRDANWQSNRKYDEEGNHDWPRPGKGPKNYRRPDERIAEDVNRALTEQAHIDATDIDVEVNEGIVILKGQIGSRSGKRKAEEFAERVWGVKDVENQIRVYSDRRDGGDRVPRNRKHTGPKAA